MAAYTPEIVLSASALSVTSSVPFASAAVTGHVDGTLSDVMFGLMATDTSELQLRSRYMTDAESIDTAMLCSIQSPSEAEPFRFLGLQWVVRGESRSKSSTRGPRDFVLLVASGLVRREVPGASETQEIGYYLCHSIDMQDCGELESQGFTRGWMSTFSLFTQSKDNPVHVDVFSRGFVDYKGKMPDYQATNMTATLLLSGIAEAASCGQNNKLSWLLNFKGAAAEFRRNQPEANARSNRCGICDRKFGVLHSVASCSLCQSKMCSRCRVSRDLSFVKRSDATLSVTESRSWDEGHHPNAQVRSLTAVLCKNCIMSSSRLDARVMARREIQGVDFSEVENTVASSDIKAPEPQRRISFSSSMHSGSERTFEVFEAGKPVKMKFWTPGGDKAALQGRNGREDKEEDKLSKLETLETKTNQVDTARMKLQSSMRSSASTVPSPRDHEHEQSFELMPYQQPRHQPQYVAEEPEISYTYRPQHSAGANSRADLTKHPAMKYFLSAVGVAATLTQSWLYFYPVFLHTPLLSGIDTDVPNTCTFANESTATSCNAVNTSLLSIVHTQDRAAEIEYMVTHLTNEQRAWSIDGQDLPIYTGPVARPGSIAEQLQHQDLMVLSALKPDTPELMAALAMHWLPQLTSVDAYTRFYELFHPIVDVPIATKDYGDAAFGAERLSLRGFNLRAIRQEDDDPVDTTLTTARVAQVCGANASVQSLRADKKMYVVDLSTIGQWGNPSAVKVESTTTEFAGSSHPQKYLPSVVGYFCFNNGQLMPLAIKLLDSSITYTPFDSPDEWQLAKTALNAAESTFQQMQHFSESHTLSIPIRVELYRSFAAAHPVRTLLMRHFALDFGLEQQAGIVLFNTSTPLDQTFGIGAAGCVRLLEDQRKTISLLDDIYSDVKTRGIQQLPHKYVAYGKLHTNAIARFVRSYLDVFYRDDQAVRMDVELQRWAAECAKVPHLHDFPGAFKAKKRLHQLLTRLIFQSVVKHHAMNGEVTWTTVAMPYSAAALWKPLPDRKERDGHPKVDVFSYLQPRELFPSMVFLSALFNRPRPEETTLQSVYHVTPFTDDPRLQPAIRAYDEELQAIDNFIEANEAHESHPYHILRPGNLPHNTWI
ncbi:hypothetical protein JM18_008061 [Phytophthora kernoviae]|uniref:Lipoxygenase domain-containing protein n=2 Tax=Phytophthora kernoviae TaxID=325452 RepID=A0A8T0LQA0_9STRA|nr:hypothetical protein G195_009955 [Phytophthora kernoviae 00238/432]KAG2512399.1 hypothetical protein JM16_008088 [Phytophthora kernoviae]KAG2515875.1 hypothetical protein JM18_008061 [Phytophthora kernoviae]